MALNEPIRGKAAEQLRAVTWALDEYPAPDSRAGTVSERLVDAAPDLVLLVLFAGVAFVAAVATANRQSVTGQA